MSTHARAIDILTEKVAYYDREVRRFTDQVKHRLNQLDELPADGDQKFINTLLDNARAAVEKYTEWGDALRESIAVLEAADRREGGAE